MALQRDGLAIGLAAAILIGCGAPQAGPSNAVPNVTANVAATRRAAPPNAAGTYKGGYEEVRDGKTVTGHLRIVIKQRGWKIFGPFDIRGHHNPVSTRLRGSVRNAPPGQTLLRFWVWWLAGYDDNVDFRGRVMGATLNAEGHSQATTGGQSSRWKLSVTKVSD